MQPTIQKIVLAGIAAMIAAVPGWVKILLWLVLGLLTLDTFTGVWLAKRMRLLRSRAAREMFAAKCLQYVTICAILAAPSAVLVSCIPIGAGLGWIVCLEIISNLENLDKLNRFSGLYFPPGFRRFLLSASSCFPSVSSAETEAHLEDRLKELAASEAVVKAAESDKR